VTAAAAAALTWAIANLVVGIRVRTMAISAAVCVAVGLVWLAAPGESPGPTEQGMALANRVVLFYALSAVCFVLVAWRLTASHSGRRALSIESLAVAMAGVIAGRTAVSTSTGDVLVGSGLVCEHYRRVDCAVALYTEAGRRDPSDERAFTRLVRVRIEEAESAAAAGRRDELFQDAADQLRRAFSADPFDYHHARNRGSLERRWAQRLPPPDRARHLEEAERWYAAATALAPSAADLWAEWANLKLERRLPDEALPRLERSAALGGGAEVSTLCDLLLRVIGIDVARTGGLAQAAVTLRERGYPLLAERYDTRASAASAAVR
jgi:tetratricopeptide (TPR) repeat protein